MSKAPVIAAIDIGTNSFHMVIASVDEKGNLNVISKDKEVVRLGSSSGDMKYLQNEAIKRGVSTLNHFAEIAKAENATIRAVATSAVREADNKEEFIDKVKNSSGIDIEVVTGLEEARLINIGVIHALPLYNKKALTIDIGGGSTETIIGYLGHIEYINSVKLGAIRLTKKYFDLEITKNNIERCCNFIKGEWTPVLEKIKENGFDTMVGTSGTITNLVLMSYLSKNKELPPIINGLTVSSKEILKTIEKIKKCKSNYEISKLNGIDEARADIILAGALIIEYAIKFLEIKEITLSAYALREGIVFDTIQKRNAIEQYHHLSDLRYQTVQNVCFKYNVDMKHARHVKKICLDIFNDLHPLHNLGYKELELLEAAAYLHDVGFHISHDSHHKHSYYIIKNCMMPGFTNNETELLANIARYHRKSHPKKKHSNYNSLSEYSKNVIWTLSAILRIAEGIDRRQNQCISGVRAFFDDFSIDIELIQKSDAVYPDIELWGSDRRKGMLEEKFDRKVSIRIVDK